MFFYHRLPTKKEVQRKERDYYLANEVALQHIYRLFYKQLTEVSFEVVKDEEMARRNCN